MIDHFVFLMYNYKMKIVNYSRLNKKNKTRVDTATARYDTLPLIAHHSTISTRSIKFVRSIVTVTNPITELNLVVGGKIRTTQIALDK